MRSNWWRLIRSRTVPARNISREGTFSYSGTGAFAMPAKVTLTVIHGKASEEEFVFAERTTCIIGRSSDCRPRIPNNVDHRAVSRHHCLLDINPPDVRVRDFGSLNGTRVNGKKIGQRQKGSTPDEGKSATLPEHDLQDGDEIRVGATVFRVGVILPPCCSRCGTELTAKGKKADVEGLCAECRKKKAAPPAKRPEMRCSRCGQEVAAEVGHNRHGAYVCLACRQDPLELLKQFLDNARRSDQDLMAIEGYSLLKELGRGGMGAVYLAQHAKTGKQVALKVMLPRVAVERNAQENFLREARNTQALRHPHVVELHEVGCSEGTFFFTLEYCDGGSVDRLMKERDGKLSVEEAVPLILQCLGGLDYAHHAKIPVRLANGTVENRLGLVHRDLSPHNLFLDGSTGIRRAKVGDFGLAKAFDAAGLSGQTSTGVAAGKPYFMPRQQVVDYLFSKPEVDVWAMAASLYNMLTGCMPRDFPRHKDVWQVVLTDSAVPIRERVASIPRRLAEAIDLALIDKPKIKVQTASEFKRMLEKAL